MASASRERLDQARAKLHRTMAALLRDFPAASSFVSATLDLLVEIETGYPQDVSVGVPAPGKRVNRFYRKGDSVLGYRVDGVKDDERLQEVRRDVAFKCPRNVYRALAKVISRAPKRGLLWTDVTKALAKELQYKPVDSQPRVAFRFWLSLRPPLATRYGTWTLPADRATFVADTDAAWEDLRRRTAKQDAEREGKNGTGPARHDGRKKARDGKQLPSRARERPPEQKRRNGKATK